MRHASFADAELHYDLAATASSRSSSAWHTAPQECESRALVLHPGAGGRCKKRLIVYEPATEPIRFRMGIGPPLDSSGLSYYRRPEHLRTNRTKNRRPGHSKTLVCNIVMATYY